MLTLTFGLVIIDHVLELCMSVSKYMKVSK